MAAALAAAALLWAWSPSTAAGRPSPQVTLAIVPNGVEVSDLAPVPGLSLGLLSAGIGEVAAERTYLDISAGNRDRPPSDAVPGLLDSTLERAGMQEAVRRSVVPLGALGRLVGKLRGEDLLIALAAPPPAENEGLALGIAGRGFDGNLTSDSTRTDGYVLSTDLAPTILERLGVAIPDEMNGEPIRSEGRIDAAAVEQRAERMKVIPERRSSVVIACLAAWIGITALLSLLRPAIRGAALRWVALAFAYMPLMLLAGAAVEPSGLAEGALVGFGAAGLAALTQRLAPGWWALAIACAVTVLGYAIDLLAGSDLTVLSLLGPNPIYGVRFYGIGNELEALIAVMVPAGVGAALSGLAASGRAPSRHAAIAAFLIAGAVAAAVFAAGRFGADVGGAIVLPVGAAVAAACVPVPNDSTVRPLAGRGDPGQDGPAMAAVLIAAPLVGLAALAVIDLIAGGDAHLTRSVFDAGGAGELADVAERRLRHSAEDFARAADNPLFWLVVGAFAVAIGQWRRIDAWLGQAPMARAGLFGAAAATAVGVLANDSGAIFLALGGVALGALVAFGWAQQAGTGTHAHGRTNP